jgi:hypothetical protein
MPLRQLPGDRFLVLNNVTMRYGNIDHLAIRRDGAVFLIETKSHLGVVTADRRQRLRLDGRSFNEDPLRQIHRNIRWLRGMIEELDRRNPWINAVLVFPYASVRVRGSVKRVTVCHATQLVSILTRGDGGSRSIA